MRTTTITLLFLAALSAACSSSEDAGRGGSGLTGEEPEAVDAGRDAADADAEAGYGFCVDMHRVVCEAACDWDERVRACTYQPGGLTAYSCFAELATGNLWVSPYDAPFESITDRFRRCNESERELAMDSPRLYAD